MKGFFSQNLRQQQALLDQRQQNIEDEKKQQKKLLGKAERGKEESRIRKQRTFKRKKALAKKSVFAERSKKVAAGAFGLSKD